MFVFCSALKLVHLFSINPYLGPLQISLGRMVIDIVKFFFIYSLVLFSFACGTTITVSNEQFHRNYIYTLRTQVSISCCGTFPTWRNRNVSHFPEDCPIGARIRNPALNGADSQSNDLKKDLNQNKIC